MEDYKKLVERLREDPKDSRKAVLSIYDLCVDAAYAIESLLDKLKYAEGERDVVTKRMIELEEQNAALRQQEQKRTSSDCKHGESCKCGVDVECCCDDCSSFEPVTNRNGLKVVEIDQVKPLTNADHIRSMSDEELAEFLWGFNLADVSTVKMGEFGPHMFRYRLKEWLQQPAEEVDHA